MSGGCVVGQALPILAKTTCTVVWTSPFMTYAERMFLLDSFRELDKKFADSKSCVL